MGRVGDCCPIGFSETLSLLEIAIGGGGTEALSVGVYKKKKI